MLQAINRSSKNLKNESFVNHPGQFKRYSFSPNTRPLRYHVKPNTRYTNPFHLINNERLIKRRHKVGISIHSEYLNTVTGFIFLGYETEYIHPLTSYLLRVARNLKTISIEADMRNLFKSNFNSRML